MKRQNQDGAAGKQPKKQYEANQKTIAIKRKQYAAFQKVLANNDAALVGGERHDEAVDGDEDGEDTKDGAEQTT
jgi:hypothetical protein